jgi:hypothetical protein
MLQFLHHFKAHALPFSVRFRNRPQHLVNTLPHRWQALNFSSKSWGIQWKNISNLLFEFIKCSWFWMKDHVWANNTKMNYMEAIFLALDTQYIDQLCFCEATCGQKVEHGRDRSCLTVPLRSSYQEEIVEHIHLTLCVYCVLNFTTTLYTSYQCIRLHS